ncbi:MAG: hypothetical protein M3Y45_01975, partial [Actinomycetota bacterium]|nr:hypothetical protein [Actinomycetota bacterium]
MGSLTLMAALVLAPAAGAGTVSTAFETLTFTAPMVETNQVNVDLSGPDYVITDDGAAVTAGFGCVSVTPDRATCSATGIETVQLSLGPGGDTADFGAAIPAEVRTVAFGEAGDDQLTAAPNSGTNLYGGDGADLLTGGDSRDSLSGGEGPDRLDGGAGSDSIQPGPGDDIAAGGTGGDYFQAEPVADGADRFRGGPGLDSLIYQNRT